MSVTRNGNAVANAPFAIIAVIIGILIGAALGLYAAYVVLPPDFVLRDASPRFLRYDPSGNSVQYRDLYIARVAQRFSAGGGSDAALAEVQDSLGVTKGDASPQEALRMARAAEQAASIENKNDGGNPDAGRFTLGDENNLRALGDRLDAVKDAPVQIAQGVADARRNALIYGLLGIALLTVFLLGLLFLLSGLFNRVFVPTLSTVSTVSPANSVTATYQPPARVGALNDPAFDQSVTQNSPLATQAGTLPIAPIASAASPVSGEAFVNKFSTTYRHGADLYDDGFQISAPTGELMGECGASIAHRYGMDSVPKVVGLTIWVFDKNDFQSTSKVLATPFALNMEAIRRELAGKGELVQAHPGLFEVVTSLLRVEVEVRNLIMQPVENDPNGYFDTVDLEFRVFKRS